MGVSIDMILVRTMRLTTDDGAFALFLVAGLTILTVLGDVYAPNAILLLNIVTVVAHFYVLRRIIRRNDLASGERLGGFAGLFGIGIVSGLAILAGAIALLLPGLFLAARWGMANTVLIAEEQSVSAAMSKSWHATKGNSIAIMTALLVLLLPGLIGMGGLIAIGYYDVTMIDTGTIGFDAVLNVLISVSQVVIWYFEVALYAVLIGSPSDTLNEVFA